MSSPKAAAIIMDGNRRWAKKNNLPSASGHRKGIEALIEIVKTAKENSLERLVVYAFSTENWNRQDFEVNALMNLINFGVDVKLPEIIKNKMRLKFIGDLSQLPVSAQKGIEKCIEATKNFEDFNLTVALNYGAIWDIIESFKKMKQNKVEITETSFIKNTQISDTNVDIFIRTGGDKRLSNFLLPNLSYTELFFSERLWPDFHTQDLKNIVESFESRQRRFGK